MAEEQLEKRFFDVDQAGFQELVIEASKRRPIVVDFWAPWCAPCRLLSPILEKAVSSLNGAAVLAKLNVDEAPGLAAQYEIMSIPAVKIFREGQVVGEFVGLKPESEVREILSRFVPS